MRIGLVLLLIVNSQASNAGSSGLPVLLLHYGLQSSPLRQLLLVTGLELAALGLITPGAHNININTFLSSSSPRLIVQRKNVLASKARPLSFNQNDRRFEKSSLYFCQWQYSLIT